jgi:hypothetical protein
MTGSEKHASLLRHGIKTGPGANLSEEPFKGKSYFLAHIRIGSGRDKHYSLISSSNSDKEKEVS